jgi:hypothetical protein
MGVAFRGLLGAVLLVGAQSGALATPITYKFEGVAHCSLTELFDDRYVPCGGEFGNGPSPSDFAVSGSFTYDTDHVQQLEQGGQDGSWAYRAVSSGLGYGINWTIGSVQLALDTVTVLASRSVQSGEGYSYFTEYFQVSGGGRSPRVDLQQCDPDALGNEGIPSMFAGPGIPDNFSLASWNGRNCKMDSAPIYATSFSPEHIGYHLYGKYTSFYRVPEPSGLALIPLGLVGLAFARSTRRRR